MLDMKSRVTNNAFSWLIGRFNIAEERNNELKDESV